MPGLLDDEVAARVAAAVDALDPLDDEACAAVATVLNQINAHHRQLRLADVRRHLEESTRDHTAAGRARW